MRFCGRPIRSSMVASALLLAAFGTGFADSVAYADKQLHEKKHDAKRQVEQLEEQWRTAQLTGDVATMDRMLSEDYIGISMTGQVNTKIQQLDRVRDRKFSLTRFDLGEMQIKLVGAVAIVTSRAEVEGTNDGMPVKGTFRYTRVYQRLPSGVWKITSFEATRVPTSTDALNQKNRPSEKAASVPPVPKSK
jgi:ketosteroid isomerase-like protein